MVPPSIRVVRDRTGSRQDFRRAVCDADPWDNPVMRMRPSSLVPPAIAGRVVLPVVARPTLLAAILCAVAVLTAMVPASVTLAVGGTYYVATTGSDSAGGSSTHPWRTLQRAANVAPAGSTIRIRGGTYAPFTITRPSLTFETYGSEAVSVAGNSSRDTVIRISGTRDVTLRGMTVRGAPVRFGAGVKVDGGSTRITIEDIRATENRSFGVLIEDSTYVTVQDSEILKNETGIQISRAGTGTVISSNSIHDNDRMIINDATAWNDRGANAVVFYRTTGAISVRNNTIYGHRASSHDYGFDGGAFEIYGASNMVITGNRLYNNENVIETGTDGPACSNIRFTRNRAWGGNDGGRPSYGLILRCASDSLVANNTFYDLTDFVFYLKGGGAFAGSIERLRIRNNIAVQPNTKIYSLDTGIPSSVTIDHDLVWNAAGGSIAWVAARGNTRYLGTLTSWTGYQDDGLRADPRLDMSDMRPRAGSPAIDAGIGISGVTTGFMGAGPDIGRYEVD